MNVDLPPPGPLATGGLRVTALGGINEIGRNMTVFEHLGRLLIIDCGVMFPTHDEPGVDLILPDLRHIEDRLDDIEALVLTARPRGPHRGDPVSAAAAARHPGGRLEVHPGAGRRQMPRVPHQTGVRRGQRGPEQQARRLRMRVLRRQPLHPGRAGHRGLHGRGDGAAHRRHQARPTAPRWAAHRPARHVAARRRRRRPVPVRLDQRRDPRRRAVGKRGGPDAAPADPRRRRPRHRGRASPPTSTGCSRSSMPRWRWAGGCRSSGDRWCATWASRGNWASCGSTTPT